MSTRFISAFVFCYILQLYNISSLKAQATPQLSLQQQYEAERKLVKQYSYQDSAKMYEHGRKTVALLTKLKQPSLEAEIMMTYANYFFFQGNYKKAAVIYAEAEAIAKEYGNDTLENVIHLKNAFIAHELGNWTEAKKIFEEVIANSEKVRDTTTLIEALNGYASLKDKQNKNDEALDIFNRALRIAQRARSEHQYAYLLNNRALLNMKLNYNSRARADLLEALKLTHEDRLAGNLLNNIGLIWLGEQKQDSALYYFQKFYSLAKKNNLPEWLVVSLINISQIKASKGNIDEALKSCDSALNIAQQHGNIFLIPRILNALADLSNRKNDYSMAIDYAKRSLKASETVGSIDDIPTSWSILSQTYAAINDHAQAYEAMKNFKQYDDSLKNISSQKRFNELLVQYDVEQKEKAIQQEKNKIDLMNKERELQTSRVRFWFILLAAAGVIISGALYIWYIRNTRKQQERFSQQLIESIEGERSRIAKELHDDIGANLSIVKNKIFINNDKGDRQLFTDLSSDISQVIEQTRSISHQLYPSYLYKLSANEAITHFLKRVEQDTSLTVHLHFESQLESEFSPLTKMHLFRIIQELVNNTIKHADASTISLDIRKESEEKITMIYTDDGNGISNPSGGGIGMTSMKERVKMLSGKMKIEEAEKGCRISFTFSTKA